MLVKFVLSLVLVYFVKPCCSKVMCKSENNNDLDWYIIIQYPSSSNFYYLSSASNGKLWELPDYALNDDRNLVSNTLRQAYNSKNEETFYAFYNDKTPENLLNSSSGHLKGVVNFDKETGYWLVHSVPGFPPTNSYFYPNAHQKYGQSFLCVSLKTIHLNSLVTQLLMMYAGVYSYYIPKDFTEDTILKGELIRLAENNYFPTPKIRLLNFETVNNVPLIHFGKSKEYNFDLYDNLIVPGLKSSLLVESWQNGKGGRISSSCTSRYKVMNVLKVKIENHEFHGYEDHSKWAITLSNKVNGSCVGDLNRMNSQFLRGGGSLCIFESNLWMSLASSVVDFEKCQN